MADPRLDSLHLEAPRRQDFRRARELLLRARGSHTIYVSQIGKSPVSGNTIIPDGEEAARTELSCWLSDGDFVYPLQVGVNTLGRSSENDVVVDDAYVSRRHCAILLHSTEAAELHDTASKNGTYLNGSRLTGPVSLKPGDEIRISARPFVFRTRSGHAAGPSFEATLDG
jgi:hypothetical protein